jgi:hypothetical protein
MNYLWGRGWFRITVDQFDGPPKTYWFFNPSSGGKGGLVTAGVLAILATILATLLTWLIK